MFHSGNFARTWHDNCYVIDRVNNNEFGELMKRIFTIFLMALLSVAIMGVRIASAGEPCSDVRTVKFGPLDDSPKKQVSKIINALGKYTERSDLYFSEERNRFELCFEVGEFSLENAWVSTMPNFTGSFLLPIAADNEHDVYIKGLNITREDALVFDDAFLRIEHNGQGKVILDDVRLNNVKHGLSVSGSGLVEVNNSVITGDAAKIGTCVSAASNNTIFKGLTVSGCNEGIKLLGMDAAIEESTITNSNTCLFIDGDGALVKNSEIHTCVGDGIRIEADDVLIGAASREGYDANKNLIHGNGIGIHVVTGSRNRFGYNNVYENMLQGRDDASADNGITIEAGANENLARPVIVVEEESGLPLRCTADEKGIITKRELWFEVPGAGEIGIYNSDDGVFSQGSSLVASCSVLADGKCVIENPILLEALPNTQCGISNYFVTALFTSSSSTRYLADSIVFNGRIGSIIAVPYDLPMPVSGVVDQGGNDGGVFDDDFEGGEDALYISGGGSEMGGGNAIAAGGASAGLMKCSLSPDAKATTETLVLTAFCFIMVLGVFISTRKSVTRKIRNSGFGIRDS
jgi:hypothetical protein